VQHAPFRIGERRQPAGIVLKIPERPLVDPEEFTPRTIVRPGCRLLLSGERGFARSFPFRDRLHRLDGGIDMGLRADLAGRSSQGCVVHPRSIRLPLGPGVIAFPFSDP